MPLHAHLCVYMYACVHVCVCMCVCCCGGIRKNTNTQTRQKSIFVLQEILWGEQTQCFSIYDLISCSEDLLGYCLVVRTTTKWNTKMTYPILLASSGAHTCPSAYALHALVWFIITQDWQAVEYDSGLPHTVLIRMGSWVKVGGILETLFWRVDLIKGKRL